MAKIMFGASIGTFGVLVAMLAGFEITPGLVAATALMFLGVGVLLGQHMKAMG